MFSYGENYMHNLIIPQMYLVTFHSGFYKNLKITNYLHSELIIQFDLYHDIFLTYLLLFHLGVE